MEPKIQLEKFKNSLTRLEQVLQRDIKSDDIVLDATIQRFEFTFENGWKAIKHVLHFLGESCDSPRSCIKKAYEKGWIKDEGKFLELLRSRNLTAHTYSFEIAMEVYETIKNNYQSFWDLYNNLTNLLNKFIE